MWEQCQWEVENNAYQSVRWTNAHWLNASKIFKQTFEPSSSWHRRLVWSKLRNAVWMHGFQSKTIVNYRPVKFYNPHFKMLFGWMVSPLNLLLYWIKTVGKKLLSTKVWKIIREISGSTRPDASTPLAQRLSTRPRSRDLAAPADQDAIHRRPIQTRFIRGAGADDTRERITWIHGESWSAATSKSMAMVSPSFFRCLPSWSTSLLAFSVHW